MKREPKNVQEISLPGVDPEGAVPVGEVREEQAGEMPASAEVQKGVEGDKGVEGPHENKCRFGLARPSSCGNECHDWDICRFGKHVDERCWQHFDEFGASPTRCIGSECASWLDCTPKDVTPKDVTPNAEVPVAAEKCRIYADPDMICAEDECGEWEACKNIQPKCVYIGYENSDCNPRICYNFAICHYGMRRESANRSWRQSVGLE